MRLEQENRRIKFLWVLHFNSIKVRLELVMVKLIIRLLLYFNSIKVRLEPSVRKLNLRENQVFQFHKGAIRTFLMTRATCGLADFNSIKVRLEQNNEKRTHSDNLISIP